MRIGSALVIIWLLIGVVAAGQRNYFSSSTANCAKLGTIAVTVVAGPLNYVGVNPKVKCQLPQPSK
jgi:membrane protein YdbS with pleckstrin-like domain